MTKDEFHAKKVKTIAAILAEVKPYDEGAAERRRLAAEAHPNGEQGVLEDLAEATIARFEARVASND